MSNVRYLKHRVLLTVSDYKVVQITEQSNTGALFGNGSSGREFALPGCNSVLISTNRPSRPVGNCAGGITFYVRGDIDYYDHEPVVMSDDKYEIFSRLCDEYNKYYYSKAETGIAFTREEWQAFSEFVGFNVAAIAKDKSGAVYCYPDIPCRGDSHYFASPNAWHVMGGLREMFSEIDWKESMVTNPYFKGEK